MKRPLPTLLAAIATVVITAALAVAVLARPSPPENLPQRVTQHIGSAGAAHPVTAVLLDFRSYDTLLEVAVLLVAVVVALALREAQPDGPDRMGLDNPLLRAVMSWLLPLMLLVSAYLLWAGSTRPGGAFQAGAVLAAAGVLLRLAGVRLGGFGGAGGPTRLRALLALGPAVFAAVGLGTLLGGRAFLDYPPAIAGGLILAIELALTLSIALALLSLFRLTPPQSDLERLPDRRRRPRE